MLGDALFKKALHEYMARWHGKHPIPWDYFNSMSNASGQDLSWFFQSWFFTNGYIDLAVGPVSGSSVTVNNVGGFVASPSICSSNTPTAPAKPCTRPPPCGAPTSSRP